MPYSAGQGVDGTRMPMVIVASAAALTVAVGAVLLSWRSQVLRSRRLEQAVHQLDAYLAGVTESLRRALETSQSVRRASTPEFALVLDLDESLARVAREAAARSGASAAAVRVHGAVDAPAVATYGSGQAARFLESASRATGDRPFRALTFNWILPPALEADEDVYRSALVVPVLERGLETGAIAAYSREPMAFRPEHVHALEALAAEAAEGIAIARRFTALGRRVASAGSGRSTAAVRPQDRTPDDVPPQADAPGDARHRVRLSDHD